MKKIVMLFLFFIYSFSAIVNAQSGIVGKWESVNRSNTGVGTSYELFSDSTFVYSISAMVDFIYSNTDSLLILAHVDSRKEVITADTSKIVLNNDSLIQTITSGDSLIKRTFVRVSKNPEINDPLLGIWNFTNSIGQIMIMDFREDMMMYLRVPYKSERGSYSINSGKINFNFENIPSREKEIITINNMLILKEPASGKEESFIKVR